MSDSVEKNMKPVYIQTRLYDQIAVRAKSTGFDSVENYILFVLEEVLKDDEDEPQAISKEDEEEVKKRLKALGYIE